MKTILKSVEEVRDFLEEATTEHIMANDLDIEITTFESEGILSGNEGLVIRSKDREWQISIVRSA